MAASDHLSPKQFVPSRNDVYVGDNNVSKARHDVQHGQVYAERRNCPNCGRNTVHDVYPTLDDNDKPVDHTTCNGCQHSKPWRFSVSELYNGA